MDRRAYIRVRSENGDFDLIYPITNADNIELIDDASGTLTNKLRLIDETLENSVRADSKGQPDGVASLGPDGLIPLSQIPVENREMRVVENIEQMYAIEPKFEGLTVFVKDATGDLTVKSGAAYYVYDGNKFVKTGQADTMNVVVNWDNVENKPTTLAGYGITDAVHQDEKVKYGIAKNAGKILVLNQDGDLDTNITGRAGSTARLDIPRKITFKGDLEGYFMFDGAANVDVALKLLSKGIKPGEYTKVQVDERGQIIGVGKMLPTDMPNIDWSKIIGKPKTLSEMGITDQVMVRDKDQHMSSRLIMANDPKTDMEVATKHYVDNMAFSGGGSGGSGGGDPALAMKSVKTVATQNIILAGLTTVNEYQIKDNDRVLVTAQTDAKQNGIYIANANAWTRATDMDADNEFVKGATVLVEDGLFGGRKFALISSEVTLGRTPIEFTEISGQSVIIAGAGLTREGNRISLDTVGITPGQYVKVTVDAHGRVVSAQRGITISDIVGGISWADIKDAPSMDDFVNAVHSHTNKMVLDKLSENGDGNLIYDGREITGSGGGGGGGTITGTLTTIGTSPSENLAVGGMWFDTRTPQR